MKKRFLSKLLICLTFVIMTKGYTNQNTHKNSPSYSKIAANNVIYSFDDEANKPKKQPVETKTSEQKQSTKNEIDWDNFDNTKQRAVYTPSVPAIREKPPQSASKEIKVTQQSQWSPTAQKQNQYIHPITLSEQESSDIALAEDPKEKNSNNSDEPANTQTSNSTSAQDVPQQKTANIEEPKTILINFNNVNIIELLRFISKVSNKNFYFDEEELNFNVTIISEEPTTIENVLMALLQELRIHGFSMMEQGDNIIIHASADVKSPGAIKADSLPATLLKDADIVTQVFRLNTASAANVAAMIQPILSKDSIVEVLEDTNHLIITDINGNVEKVALLIKSIDAPNSSLIIGQYVVRNAFMDTLLQNAQTILQSIAPGQTVSFIAHAPSNSIFIVSTPFLVERAIPILQRLDQFDGMTGIYNLDDLKYIPPELMRPGEIITPEGTIIQGSGLVPQQGLYGGPQQGGRWRLDSNGNWYYEPDENALRASHLNAEGKLDTSTPPEGFWRQDAQGNWEFVPGSSPKGYPSEEGPKGHWELGPDGKWRYVLTPGESIYAGKKVRTSLPSEGLPLGHIERTKFLIHKLNYRLGDTIETAILKIGDSMRNTEAINTDLISTINSVQWLEASNSLIFTGTPESLLKVKELVEEIDQPLRQVFIEMLILETSVDDSLNYSVNWGSQFTEQNVAGIQAFAADASPLNSILASAGVTGTGLDLTPVTANREGYDLGIIGQKVCAGGVEFSNLGALVRAVHSKADVNIVMNPKIITEDNVTAEIFVGLNTSFKTQSVSNDRGSIITNNFEFRDVGTTLRVTPLLGPSNIITLQIEEEVSNVITTQSGGGLTDTGAGPTTRINRTTTQVHIPDKFFLVISGMVQDQVERSRKQVPCLGGAPLIGAAFSSKSYLDQKRCLMIFIRPQLIDTEKEINDLTTHQQNIYRLKRRTKKMWKLDCEEALDWLNLKEIDTINDERRCCDFKY